ncbi:unnamed protein product [Closterium sp. NIES-53]
MVVKIGPGHTAEGTFTAATIIAATLTAATLTAATLTAATITALPRSQRCHDHSPAIASTTCLPRGSASHCASHCASQGGEQVEGGEGGGQRHRETVGPQILGNTGGWGVVGGRGTDGQEGRRDGDVTGQVMMGEVMMGEVMMGEVMMGEVMMGEVMMGEVMMGEVMMGQMMMSEVMMGEVMMGEVMMGEVMMGEVMIGEVMMGEVMMGEMMMGEVMMGEVMMGEVMMGEVMMGEVMGEVGREVGRERVRGQLGAGRGNSQCATHSECRQKSVVRARGMEPVSEGRGGGKVCRWGGQRASSDAGGAMAECSTRGEWHLWSTTGPTHACGAAGAAAAATTTAATAVGGVEALMVHGPSALALHAFAPPPMRIRYAPLLPSSPLALFPPRFPPTRSRSPRGTDSSVTMLPLSHVTPFTCAQSAPCAHPAALIPQSAAHSFSAAAAR